MRRFVIGMAVLSIGTSLLACSSTGGTGGTLDGTNWTLTSYSVSGTSTTPPASVVVDAHFADGKVSGFAGCNVYSATTTISGATLTVGAAVTTQKACEADVQAVETAYLANLASAATYTATADALTIYNSSGASALVYTVGAANPLVGAWNVTGIYTGNAVTSPIAGTTVTATFTPDGTVAGSTGCNEYNGPYTLDGTSLTVGPLITTRKACEEAIMEQETAFLTALQTPTTVETSGPTVTLRAADGNTQVVLAPQ